MNKLMKAAAIVVGVGAMLGFAGCGGEISKNASPEDVAIDVLKKLSSGKADAAYLKKTCTERSAASMAIVAAMFAEVCKGATFQVIAVKVSGDTAVVKVKQIGGSKEEDGKTNDINLQKVDGQWKFDNY